MLIPLEKMIRKHNLNIKGIVHVGASEGQELESYHKNNIEHIVFIEALPAVYKKLLLRTQRFKKVQCINACVSDVSGETVSFNVANNGGQSSSFLEFGTHEKMHPDVKFTKQIDLTTDTLENILLNNIGVEGNHNMLVMDLQGAEGHALRGLGIYFDQFDYIYSEVNKDEVYQGCMQVDEMDAFLKEKGFERVNTMWCGSFTWGDALYVRK